MELKIIVGPGLLYQVVQMMDDKHSPVHGKVVYTSVKYSQAMRYISESRKEVGHERSVEA